MPSIGFVGRREELSLLETRLDELLGGEGGIATISGEAGAGKTQLATELGTRATSRGTALLMGSCLEDEWQPPYAPWTEAITHHLQKLGNGDQRRLIDRHAFAIRKLLPDLMPEASDLPSLVPEQERFRLFDGVARLLADVARSSPAVLILDDLQWADADSLRLLQYVARSTAQTRLLLLLIYREPLNGLRHPLVAVLGGLRREARFLHIQLRGLDAEEVAEYLSRATGNAVPAALAASIRSETGGNPLYVREVFRHLEEEGNLLPNGSGNITSLQSLGASEGIRQIVARRVKHMSTGAAEIVRLASGFAAPFEFPALEAVSGLPEAAVLDALDEGLAAGILTVSSTNPPTYDFVHSVVRRAVYEEMNPDRRIRLHRKIALALESSYAGREMEHAAELASQYYASAAITGSARGLRYALAAAEQSRAAIALEQAAHFLTMARELSSESDAATRAEVLATLAVAQADALQLDTASVSAEDALDAMAEAGIERRSRAVFMVRLIRALKDGGADERLWEPLLRRALDLAGEERDLLWARLALLEDRMEPIEPALGLLRWRGHDPLAVSISRLRGDEEDYAQTLGSPKGPTRSETEEMIILARSWSNPTAVMAALGRAGRDLFYRHGAFHEAAELFSELLAASRRYGSISEQAQSLAYIAVVKAILGDLPAATETAAQARETIGRLGPAHVLHFVLAGLEAILAYYLGGDWEDLATATGQFAAGGAGPRLQMRTYEIGLAGAAIAAFAHHRAGRNEEARRHLEELTPVAEAVGPTTFAQNAVVTIASASVWEMGSSDLAERYRQLAKGLIDAGVGVGPVGPHELAVARMAALEGNVSAATEMFERARVVASEMGLRPSVAITNLDEARAILDSHDDGQEERAIRLLDQAMTGFQVLGMEDWIGRARALRERAEGRIPVQEAAAAPATRSNSPVERLTAREREVVGLLASGLSNTEIAERLVISVRTAEAHVASILGKLGFTSRAQVAVWATRNQPEIGHGNNKS